MKPIIKVENVSKRYRLGVRDGSYDTLRDTLAAAVKSPINRLRGRGAAARRETLWALRGVNFDVKPGEVLGLIGHNGAGKSTLLKILSRITWPTEGRVELYGRLGSLLEVGTGFHPELSGRENVYLSGAILGMGRAEIDRKLDAVVEFSGVERFLDTPVKRYSSGMYVRLAFAVAAHMEPEILLVDEVLAVGDLAFQQKCLDHMKRLKQSGMTLLLVSHNMSAIQGTCERSLYLHNGEIAAFGDTTEVIKTYRDVAKRGGGEAAGAIMSGGDDSGVRLVSFTMFGEDGESRRSINFGERVRVRIALRAERRVEAPIINFGFRRGDGVIVCNFNNWYDNFQIDYIEGDCVLEGWLPPLRLVPHYYDIYANVWPRRTSAVGQDDMSRLQPLTWAHFGDFSVEGPPLTDQDGVFQQPALRWELTREDGGRVECDGVDADSLRRAYGEEASLAPPNP
ncbi:MAG TPA: ABC transporter ATP-binding protein [Pyrinomonadaceae bacterium]|jgi:lipopolysaccharide transport system ATP-binding protein|nr:ABC transporter ATP-binding protein [Pyrinomonadaceae bacterium]